MRIIKDSTPEFYVYTNASPISTTITGKIVSFLKLTVFNAGKSSEPKKETVRFEYTYEGLGYEAIIYK